MTRWLVDILDSGPSPADPPEDDDWTVFDELEQAVAALAERLRDEPGLRKEVARLFIKTNTDVGFYFRSLIWPAARKRAGLSVHAKAGRPVGSRSKN